MLCYKTKVNTENVISTPWHKRYCYCRAAEKRNRCTVMVIEKKIAYTQINKFTSITPLIFDSHYALFKTSTFTTVRLVNFIPVDTEGMKP